MQLHSLVQSLFKCYGADVVRRTGEEMEYDEAEIADGEAEGEGYQE